MDFEKIISADELQIDAEKINAELKSRPELLVFDNNRPQFAIISLSQYTQYQNQNSPLIPAVPTASTQRIGKLVQDTFNRLENENTLSASEISNLQDPEYCTRVFGLSYPVLKWFDSLLDYDDQKRDAKGYNRYYNRLRNFGGEQFLLCSQWTELHKERFIKWMEEHT